MEPSLAYPFRKMLHLGGVRFGPTPHLHQPADQGQELFHQALGDKACSPS